MNRRITDGQPAPGRRLLPVDVPRGPDVVRRVLPALAAALDGGPALLPLPRDPADLRRRLVEGLRLDEPVDEAIALVVPTSGSTGEPKGVLLSAAAVRASATATHRRLGGPGRWLLAVPATHIAGLMILARSALAGSEPVAMDLRDRFAPAQFCSATAILHAGGPPEARRYVSLVPRQLAVLMDAGDAAAEALASYDAVLVGGDGLPDDLGERARRAGVSIVASYGMTETCGGCVYDGLPLDGVRVTIEAGRIRIAGPVVASGYRGHDDPPEVFADGWFTTSDTGRLDADGRLTVTGRLDDLAVSGGVTVPLAAVDAVVGTHPQVLAVLSVALPDPDWGERIVSAVVPRDAARPPTLRSIRTHVTDRAPVAYAPREIVVTDAMPTTPSGKLDRRALARQLRLDPPAAG